MENVIDLAFPRRLTVADIQRICQCGARQAYEIAHAAGTVRFGRSIRVRPEDLASHLERVAVRGAA
jgi:hypothetical protein